MIITNSEFKIWAEKAFTAYGLDFSIKRVPGISNWIVEFKDFSPSQSFIDSLNKSFQKDEDPDLFKRKGDKND